MNLYYMEVIIFYAFCKSLIKSATEIFEKDYFLQILIAF